MALLAAGAQGLIASTRWTATGKVVAAVVAALVAGLIDRQLVSPILDAPEQDPANAALPAAYQAPPRLPSL